MDQGWWCGGRLSFNVIEHVVFVRADKIEVALGEVWMKEEIVGHDNNIEHGAVGLH